MAGMGPDVIFTEYLNDLHKTMNSGSLLNLNEVISSDEDFNMGDYNAAVMQAGFYKGGQYIIPYGFMLPVITGDLNTLNNIGFDLSAVTDVISFVSEIGRCLPKARQNPSFRRVMEFKSDNMWEDLLLVSGITLVDMETGDVLPDEDRFRDFCEAYKLFWADDTATPVPFDSGPAELAAGDFWFNGEKSSGWFLYTKNPSVVLWQIMRNYVLIKASDGSPVFAAPASVNGGKTVIITHGLAVNASSRNQLNAWNFIKIMLSDTVQEMHNDSLKDAYIPVGNSLLEREINQYSPFYGLDRTLISYNAAGNLGFKSHFIYCEDTMSNEELDELKALFAFNDTVTAILPWSQTQDDEAKTDLKEFLSGISNAVLPNQVLLDFFRDCMEPYFNDEKSLDACISDLKSKLMIYASE
jgi:hypothetical protein